MGSSKNHQVLAVAVVFSATSWMSMLLRVYVRRFLIKAWGRDDWAMFATQVVFTIYLICQLGGVAYGTGYKLQELVPERAEKALAFWLFCEVFYAISTVLMKISIGLFLLRIAANQVHIHIIYLAMAASMVCGFAFAFVLLFQCWPIRAFWTLNPNDGHCIDSNVLSALTYTISAANVIADWVFALLPWFMVKNLQMVWKKKAIVACILAFAAVGCTATIVRLPYVWSLKESAKGWDAEFLYDTVGIAVWTTVEVGVGITAGCMATMWPLVQIILSKLGWDASLAGSRPRLNGSKSPDPSSGLQLDGLPSNQGVKTMVSSRKQKSPYSIWKSENSSEEQLAHPEVITKHTMVEYDEQEVPPGRYGPP